MRTVINLSSRPFTNHRLLWIAVVATVLVSMWFFLWMGSEKSRVLADQTRIKQRIEGQREAYQEAIKEQERRQAEQQKVVVTDQQKMELASARQLIQRKSFSWNRMMTDIEGYVPNRTRILSIKVDGVDQSGEGLVARIQIKAIGETTDEMTTMMLNLGKSEGKFVVGEAGQEATTDQGETPFTLNVTYIPARGAAQ
jgi:Tfp pilus assembly protein PilN